MGVGSCLVPVFFQDSYKPGITAHFTQGSEAWVPWALRPHKSLAKMTQLRPVVDL